MKFFAQLALPVLIISTSALVIPSATDSSHDVTAIAGSIAQSHAAPTSHLPKTTLEVEYERLEILKAQLNELHKQITHQEHEILDLIKGDFGSCSGVRCYLQTALKKAPDFFELVKTHFRCQPKIPTELHDCPCTGNVSRSEDVPSAPSPSSTPFDFVNEGPSTEDYNPFDFNNIEHEDDSNGDHDKAPPFHFDLLDDENVHDADSQTFPEPSKSDEGDNDADRSSHQPGPGQHPHNEDTAASTHPSYDPNKPNPAAPASGPQDVNTYSDASSDHKRPPFQMPHPAPRHRHFKLILAVGGLLISLVIFAVLFKALRIYCANPRVRAERAARIEECRTRREYRKAACQHRIRQYLSRFHWRKRSQGTNDYEEKRAMLRSENFDSLSSVDSHIIGADINALRRAHELVGQLVLAEEGRCPPFSSDPQRTVPQPQYCPRSQEVTASSSRSIRSIRTTTTLPPYAPPPPQYSQRLESDMQVVDGFRRTPTQSSITVTSSASSFILDDDFTESSVADCQSRLSMDTDTDTETGSIRRATGNF